MTALSGCIWQLHFFTHLHSMHLRTLFFFFLVQVEYMKKIFVASNMRERNHVWSNKITGASVGRGKVSELLSVWARGEFVSEALIHPLSGMKMIRGRGQRQTCGEMNTPSVCERRMRQRLKL